jgi:hypothetical protein
VGLFQLFMKKLINNLVKILKLKFLAVFFVGLDGTLKYFFIKENTWTEYKDSLSIKCYGDISAVYDNQKNLSSVFYQGEDYFLHYLYYNNDKWNHDGDSFQKAGKLRGSISALYEENRKNPGILFFNCI